MHPQVVSDWIAAIVPIAGPLLLGAVCAVVARIVRTEIATTEYDFVYRYVMLLPLPIGALLGALGAPVPEDFEGHVPAVLWWMCSIVPMWVLKRHLVEREAAKKRTKK